MMVKKVIWIIGVIVLAVLLVGSWFLFDSTYVLLNGAVIRRDAEEVTLSGSELPGEGALKKLDGPRVLDLWQIPVTISEYEYLLQLFPDCEILWKVPLGSSAVSPETKELRLESLSEEELKALTYLAAPEKITIERCDDYEALLALISQYPDTKINYTLSVGGMLVPMDAVELELKDADPEMLAAIPCLPALSKVIFLDGGSDPEAVYEWMQAYPDILFQWEMELFGVKASTSAEELDLSGRKIQMEELKEKLKFFRDLKRIDLSGCRDYEELLTLKEQYPELDLHYTVSVQGKEVPTDAEELILQNADAEELYEMLPHLPMLKQVALTGTVPENEAIYGLMCDYPDVTFQWDLTVCGVKASSTDRTLILSGIRMEDTAEVEGMLKYFSNLERVEMCNCGIPSADMDALSKKYPQVRFVWTIRVGEGTLRTDVTAFIPYKLGHDIDNPLYDEDCTELKYCVDLVCIDLGHMRMRDISFLEYMPNMQYLVLGDTPVRDFSVLENLKELVYLEIFNTQFTDHELLLGMTKLEDLNIGYTPATDVETLKQMTWLERLWLPGTRMTHAKYEELAAALPNTQVVRYVEHSTAGGWRDNDNYRAMRDLLGMFYME